MQSKAFDNGELISTKGLDQKLSDLGWFSENRHLGRIRAVLAFPSAYCV